MASLFLLRGDTVLETKATLKVVNTRVKCVFIYMKIEKSITIYHEIKFQFFICKGTTYFSYALDNIL